jgi:hypothetical protein
MSEYLDRLKQLRDATPRDSFTPPNVHSNVSFRKAIDYIEKLEKRALWYDQKLRDYEEIILQKNKRITELAAEQIPEELFDGYAVLKNIDDPDTRTHSPAEMVSKVLNSVVRLIKNRIAGGE